MLNKELRQGNLQQFIQQAGVLPAHSHSRTDLHELEQLELAALLQDGYRNGGRGHTQAHTHTHTLTHTGWCTHNTGWCTHNTG